MEFAQCGKTGEFVGFARFRQFVATLKLRPSRLENSPQMPHKNGGRNEPKKRHRNPSWEKPFVRLIQHPSIPGPSEVQRLSALLIFDYIVSLGSSFGGQNRFEKTPYCSCCKLDPDFFWKILENLVSLVMSNPTGHPKKVRLSAEVKILGNWIFLGERL